jgi:sulfur carrier protein ThiS
MITVTLNALSFLRPKLREKRIDCSDARLEIPSGTTVDELIQSFGLEPHEVEAVFVNGRVTSRERELHEGDRVGLVPPGTPGPHRVLLGMVKPSPK